MPSGKKLSYIRQNKALDLLPKSGEEIVLNRESDVTSSVAPCQLKGYEKTDGVMSYSIICVISGGEKRERDFLKTLIRQKDLHSLRVAFISKEGQGLQPYQMQEQWEEIQKTPIKHEVQESQYKWLDLAIQIEYGYIGICVALKVLTMLFISECE